MHELTSHVKITMVSILWQQHISCQKYIRKKSYKYIERWGRRQKQRRVRMTERQTIDGLPYTSF